MEVYEEIYAILRPEMLVASSRWWDQPAMWLAKHFRDGPEPRQHL